MAFREALGALWQRLGGLLQARRRRWQIGTTDAGDARRLADAEREAGGVPDGCAWLDERTVADVDLPLVFRSVDRTVSPIGAQALWRWLAAPAIRIDVLVARERSLARLAARPALRDQIRDALAGQSTVHARQLTRLLWEPLQSPSRSGVLAGLAGAVVVLGVLAVGWPPLAVGAVSLFLANVWVDDWASLRLAPSGRALAVLCQVLGSADRVVSGVWHDAAVASDLAVFAGFRKRIAWLTARDPLGLLDLVRAGLLVRLLLIGRWLRMVERERDRLRRLVLWLGELDALVSIASLRAERADARLPRLSSGAARIVAGGILHPAIPGAVGNDLAIDAGLVVTGSNMSGKSTFLRTIAINAICAQSIHTTFGLWTASLFRVFAVMRITDATADGMSTYAVEVAAVGQVIEAVARRDYEVPAVLVIDEPFSGTNPALRVPIAVSVLDYLGARDIVVAATHDLEVAAQVDARFARGYFREPDGDAERFDHKLRPGISPSSNALALLVRAGYPPAIIAAAERRASAGREPTAQAPAAAVS